MSYLDLDRDTYTIVAARRTQFDQLVWQVPILSLTAQAFLFSIALSADATRRARVIACLLSLLMTVLCLHLMVKHRQAEVADSQWLEKYEAHFKPTDPSLPWPMHGAAWSGYRQHTDPKIGWLRFIASSRNGFMFWFGGLALFGFAALAVLVLTAVWPELLGPK
jgi:hypothetical protein